MWNRRQNKTQHKVTENTTNKCTQVDLANAGILYMSEYLEREKVMILVFFFRIRILLAD